MQIWNAFLIVLLKIAQAMSKAERKKKYEDMSKEELIKENKSKDAEIKNLKY